MTHEPFSNYYWSTHTKAPQPSAAQLELLVAIMKRHKKMETRDWCAYDGLDWPCDTEIVLGRLSELEQAMRADD